MRRFFAVLTVLVALAAAAATATPSLAVEPHERGLSHLQQQLALTDDQAQAIREIHARHAMSQQQLWQQIQAARREVRNLAVKGGDPAALEAKTQALGQLFNEALKLRVATLQEISLILTPEQREKYAAMVPWQHHRPGRHRPDSQS